MKTEQIFALLTFVSISLFPSISHAADITANGSGNWSSIVPNAPWPGGIVPATNDSVDVEAPFNITVDSAATIAVIYGGGTVTMAPNSTLNIIGDQATDGLLNLVATATGNTVAYLGNPFYAKECNYYNLVFANTNYVDPFPPYYPYQNFNNFSRHGPTSMSIAGNMTVIGYTKVQQGSGGADINIGGNLIIGTNCVWDSSGANLTVASNAIVGGLLEDLNGALGSSYIGGNVTITGTGANGWNVSDVTTWSIGGSLTNNGLIFGKAYGSISFDGIGIITGSEEIKIPTITINGIYNIGTTITLTTNTPTLNGTLVFDLANANQIILPAYVGTSLYYSGILDVINTGPAPASGNSYKLFDAPSYGGSFDSTSFPSLPGGLSWVDNLAASGSIAVLGSGAGSPVITLSRAAQLLILSWDSGTFTGYSVQGQTNSGGIGTVWVDTGSGTVSPFVTTIDPSNPSVFFRLFKP